MPRRVQEAAGEMRLQWPDARPRRLRKQTLCIRRLRAGARPCPRSGNGLRRVVDRQRGTRCEHRRNVESPTQPGQLGGAGRCRERASAVHDDVHGNMDSERPPCPGEPLRPAPSRRCAPRPWQRRGSTSRRGSAELAACNPKLSRPLRARPHVVQGAGHARSGHHGAVPAFLRKGAPHTRRQAAAGTSARGPGKRAAGPCPVIDDPPPPSIPTTSSVLDTGMPD